MAKKKYRTSDTVTTTKNPETTKNVENTAGTIKETKVFYRINYLLMVVSVLMLIVGYALMIGGKQPPDQFNSEEIYSFRRITLSPIVIVAGFVLLIFAIIWNPRSKDNSVSKY